MADPSHSRLMADIFLEIMHEEQDEEDEAILVLIHGLKYLMLMT